VSQQEKFKPHMLTILAH